MTHLRRTPLVALFFAFASAACRSSAAPPAATEQPAVNTWGSMREALRMGRTEGRVALGSVLGPHTVAVGAAEGLAAEITVVAGRAHLAEVVDASAPDGLRTRSAATGEQATLLVAADVARWSEHPLPELADLHALETALRRVAKERGLDVSQPFPFRVEGSAPRLELHVLDHACPIADPEAAPPWRFDGPAPALTLVGFFAEDSAGQLTHHSQRTHTHALLAPAAERAGREVSGHVDQVQLAAGAHLYLPLE